jgi:hypothetical protein
MTTTGPDNCFQQPDFLSCAQCLCQVEMEGCQSYIDNINAHIYCGMTCGMMCSEFCADPGGMPSPSCEMCVAGLDCSTPQPDCDAFIMACQSDPSCVGFAQSLQNCPQ